MKGAEALVIFCTSLAGCCVMTSVDIRNQSKHTISVQSAQTGKAYEIEAGAHQRIPHTAGDLVIIGDGTGEISRSAVSVPDYEAEKTCLPASWPCWRGLLLRAEFNDARGLTLLDTRRNP